MHQRKKSQGGSKEGGSRKSRAAKPKAAMPGKSELYIRYPVPKSEEEEAPKVKAPVMPFSSVKPDHILMFCNRCGKRLTLRSLNPDTPGLGPYQGYCRRLPSCMVEYVVQVNPIG